MKKKELDQRMNWARGEAAQAWCQKTTQNKIMDPILAEEFAKILVKNIVEIENEHKDLR